MAKIKKNPSEKGKSAASVKGSPNSGPVERFRDDPDHQTTNMQFKKNNTADQG
ncbi:YuzL family protein [Pontibacillus salicampi]|uniref:YuzL family protein n=1 Tax=Pontibacillus salicampi TaxID=1449801 RepID=A0ABV6LMH2_9BACI